MIKALSTPRLTLEPQTADHAAEMFTLLGDPAIYEFGNEPPPSLEWLQERYARLESRASPDGRERWLNWIARLPTGKAIGYVQATVMADGRALIAYELASLYWGHGYGREAVEAMLAELSARFQVTEAAALFHADNVRSRRLLEHLAFSAPPADARKRYRPAPDEDVLHRHLAAE